jgi:hypothetical protein
MAEHPAQVRRRLVPDEAQVQIILGSLLGDARLEGAAGGRRLRIAHRVERADYVWWKYERLGVFADCPPQQIGDRLAFVTIAHPLFDDLAPLFASRRSGGPGAGRSRVVRQLLAPLGLAVWMTDVGRLELRPELFLPGQRPFALCA